MRKDPEADSKQLVDVIVSAMEDKKGLDITYIDFTNVSNTVARFFVICHGNSNVHVDSLADGVIHNVKESTGARPWHKEGFENAEWILLDYADVVVHIFQENSRHFYKLEDLWADMAITRLDNSQ